MSHAIPPRGRLDLTGSGSTPYEFASDHILVVESAFRGWRELIELAESASKWRHETTASGATHAYRSRTSKSIPISAAHDRKFSVWELAIRTVVYEVAKFYSSVHQHASWSKDDGWELLRYEPGESFGLHVDTGGGRHTSQRQLSALVYLNDDYEGGETSFPVQGVKLKPPAGSVALFPPFWTHPHEALPPTSGTKYVVAGWLRTWKGNGFRSE